MKKFLVCVGLISMCSAFAFAQAAPTSVSGVDLYRAGSFDKAVSALESAVAIEKKNKLAWLYLGAAYLKLGDEKQAARAFRNSRFHDPESLEDFETDLKVKRKPRPTYTDRARQNKITGVIKVAVEFRADGKVGFVFPFETLPFGLTENAMTAARSIEFEPAVANGKPVDVISVIRYTFDIY